MFFSNGLIFLLIVLNIVIYYLQKQQEEDDGEQKISSPSSSSDQRSLHEGECGETKDSSSSSLSDQQCRRFSLAEIKLATHDFDDALVIGKGGFGKVYKGTIDLGATIDVAIKRLNLDSNQGATEFWAEIEMLSKFRHSHIVSLLGYCEESGKQEMILVYEYMSNGSLEDHLHGSKSSSPLTWVQRLSICVGAARGLDYLHTGTGVQCRVIHRDVKSSNILLDENWAGKISDFGLSRTGPAYQSCTTNVYTGQIRGTFGYMDSEYFSTHRLTRKSDVYAFGVVLFEVLCGRAALDFRLDEQQHSLAGWAKHCVREGTIDRFIDPCLNSQISANCLKEFTQIAYKCLLSYSKDRPTMTEVVARLEIALTLALQRHGGRVTIVEKVWSFFSIKTPAVRAKNYDRNRSKRSDDNKNKQVLLEEPETSRAVRSSESKNNGIILEEPTKAAAEESNDNVKKDVAIEEPTTTAGGSSNSINGDVINMPTITAAEGCGADTMLKAEPQNLKIFTFDELRSASRNFRPSAMLGVSSGETVYKGWVDGETYTPSPFGTGIAVAIKMSNMDDGQNLQNWQAEVSRSKFSHRNLVRILGYCSEDRMLLLVYEYMPRGSVENLLRKRGLYQFKWDTRIQIAIGAAKGLAFLHTSEYPVMHKTFKLSNIFLDEDFEVKLYFGSATLARPYNALPLCTSVVYNNGYEAPEYLAMGHWNAKSDVYGFGVLMLNIITGLRFLDDDLHNLHRRLTEWARHILFDNEMIYGWRDQDYPSKGASKAVELILSCLEIDPRKRPSMHEIVASLQEVKAIKM